MWGSEKVGPADCKHVLFGFPGASGERGFPLAWFREEAALSPPPPTPLNGQGQEPEAQGTICQMPVLGLDIMVLRKYSLPFALWEASCYVRWNSRSGSASAA